MLKVVSPMAVLGLGVLVGLVGTGLQVVFGANPPTASTNPRFDAVPVGLYLPVQLRLQRVEKRDIFLFDPPVEAAFFSFKIDEGQPFYDMEPAYIVAVPRLNKPYVFVYPRACERCRTARFYSRPDIVIADDVPDEQLKLGGLKRFALIVQEDSPIAQQAKRYVRKDTILEVTP